MQKLLNIFSQFKCASQFLVKMNVEEFSNLVDFEIHNFFPYRETVVVLFSIFVLFVLPYIPLWIA